MTPLPPTPPPATVVADVVLEQAGTSSLLRVLSVLHGRQVDVVRFAYAGGDAQCAATVRVTLDLPARRWRHVRDALGRIVDVVDVVDVVVA